MTIFFILISLNRVTYPPSNPGNIRKLSYQTNACPYSPVQTRSHSRRTAASSQDVSLLTEIPTTTSIGSRRTSDNTNDDITTDDALTSNLAHATANDVRSNDSMSTQNALAAHPAA